MNYTELSKEISYALRHAPWEYELELDEQGYVPISQLLFSLNEGEKYQREVTLEDLEYIINHSEKKGTKSPVTRYGHYMVIQLSI